MNLTLSDTQDTCPSSLSQQQVDLYHEQGYLAFENVLSSDEIEAAREGFSALVRKYTFDSKQMEYHPPQTTKDHSGNARFQSKDSDFMIQFERGYTPIPGDYEGMELQVRKFMWFEESMPIFQNICYNHPKISGILKGILKDDFNLYQSMALIKPPHGGVDKPWHQDNAYFSVENLDQVAGIWIALDDAAVENGCMHVLPGGHRLGPMRHHHTTDCEIVEGKFDTSKAVAVPVKAGGALFFHGCLPHFTPKNNSDQRRRAIQYHYRSTSNNIISKEAFNDVFKENDGTPASCAAAIPKNF
ncbi:phytanoyl-CoA dioxygenase family protein [Rubellicoccus peritrichatus]|uniref:Phytanoyl-CoA dioxygenase family protein n=1 Tax=Rubellicoccus peritrichatus TaxID=3080537 RepID=A0AAQ3QR26_9BACT|nr:phytanoyl-CoA dioxygenase family protein [Puniceicoccus sp. CR14]WOO40883.1 phytanoyl-CoA dioxygenase family protein [Puniceicoccus sp. CR14]